MSTNKKLFTYGYDMKIQKSQNVGDMQNLKYKATFELLGPQQWADKPEEILVPKDSGIPANLIRDAMKKKYKSSKLKIKFVKQLYSPDLFSKKPAAKSKGESVNDLRIKARAKNIKGYYKMKKAELIAALGGSAPAAEAPKNVKAVKPPKKKIVKSKVVKEVKPPKKKIVKSSVRAAAAADRVAEAKKAKAKVVSKIRKTDMKVAELKKPKKRKGPIMIDATKPSAPKKGDGFQILKPQKKLKSRRGKYRKGEDEPENKNLDYAALNKKIKM